MGCAVNGILVVQECDGMCPHSAGTLVRSFFLAVSCSRISVLGSFMSPQEGATLGIEWFKLCMGFLSFSSSHPFPDKCTLFWAIFVDLILFFPRWMSLLSGTKFLSLGHVFCCSASTVSGFPPCGNPGYFLEPRQEKESRAGESAQVQGLWQQEAMTCCPMGDSRNEKRPDWEHWPYRAAEPSWTSVLQVLGQGRVTPASPPSCVCQGLSINPDQAGGSRAVSYSGVDHCLSLSVQDSGSCCWPNLLFSWHCCDCNDWLSQWSERVWIQHGTSVQAGSHNLVLGGMALLETEGHLLWV